MLLNVWVAAWEFECCQPDLTVGDSWGGSLYLSDSDPWWSQYAKEPLPPDVRDFGVSQFDAEVVQPALSPDHAGVVALGTARIGVFGATTAGIQRFRGRLDFEGHGGGGDDRYDIDEWLSSVGTVTNIRGISYVYAANDDDELPQVPVALNEVRELRTTFDGQYSGGHEFATYVVELDVT